MTTTTITATKNNAVAAAPRFSTILVARSNNARPTDVEVYLRQHCHKMRVSIKLNGAHMVFPQEHSLALRIYTEVDIERMGQNANVDDTNNNNDHELNDILEFTRKFKWTLIFFVLADTKMFEQSSWLRRAMQLTEAHKFDKPSPRMIVVSNTEQVVASLIAFADGLNPVRFIARDDYTQRIIKYNSDNMSIMVAGAVRALGERMHFPVGEADILLRCLGNLNRIAAADSKTLTNIPVEERTKRALQSFFSEELTTNDDEIDYDCNMKAHSTVNNLVQVNDGFSGRYYDKNGIGLAFGGQYLQPSEEPFHFQQSNIDECAMASEQLHQPFYQPMPQQQYLPTRMCAPPMTQQFAQQRPYSNIHPLPWDGNGSSMSLKPMSHSNFYKNTNHPHHSNGPPIQHQRQYSQPYQPAGPCYRGGDPLTNHHQYNHTSNQHMYPTRMQQQPYAVSQLHPHVQHSNQLEPNRDYGVVPIKYYYE